ncbi:hypothetical protein [Microbacterium maritypicum]|jgi:hypothetical protein|uniref:hypothetical protein n=1 Tax=Microbacterium maritypicum TaxID=33918 RepID=UPI0022E40B39|nr:hypothetical protein [Microbacterium liquefaciens]
MPAHCGLSEAHVVHQVANSVLARGEVLQHREACRVGKGLEQVRVLGRRSTVHGTRSSLTIHRHVTMLSLYDTVVDM